MKRILAASLLALSISSLAPVAVSVAVSPAGASSPAAHLAASGDKDYCSAPDIISACE